MVFAAVSDTRLGLFNVEMIGLYLIIKRWTLQFRASVLRSALCFQQWCSPALNAGAPWWIWYVIGGDAGCCSHPFPALCVHVSRGGHDHPPPHILWSVLWNRTVWRDQSSFKECLMYFTSPLTGCDYKMIRDYVFIRITSLNLHIITMTLKIISTTSILVIR